MKHMLTFDIEDWYHANYSSLDMSAYRVQKSNFEQNMHRLLQLCADNNAKATFFTLGTIAEDYPNIIKDIVAQGHELACHGYSHELAYKQTPQEFQEDVRKSISILEDVGNTSIYGYRAPSWSIIKKNHEYLQILHDLGLKYDASIFPVKTFLYGIPDAPQSIHFPLVDSNSIDFHEVPMSVLDFFGKTFGYSGGFYLRFFPYTLIKHFIKTNENRGKYTIVYLHPREIDPYEKRLDLPFKERLIHYFNLKNTEQKLSNLLRDFKFVSIKEYINI